jgi:GTPase SAR1 family protein
LEDKNIKNIAEVYQSGDPAPPQTAYQKALIDTEITANTLNNNNTHICRILILGDRYTGKTSIVKRFVNDTYADEY